MLSKRDEYAILLAKAYSNGSWKINFTLASTVTNSLWRQGMVLKQFAEAQEALERLASHPDRGQEDRRYSMMFQIQGLVTRIALGENDAPYQELAQIVESGPDKRGNRALLVASEMCSLVHYLDPDPVANLWAHELAQTVIRARRGRKAAILASQKAVTVRELFDVVSDVVWPPNNQTHSAPDS